MKMHQIAHRLMIHQSIAAEKEKKNTSKTIVHSKTVVNQSMALYHSPGKAKLSDEHIFLAPNCPNKLSNRQYV